MTYEKLVVVTRKTRLDELVERFNTVGQARFYLEHAGDDFGAYQREHDRYQRARDALRAEVSALAMKQQWIDRSMLPTYVFGREDVVITLGPDGLVANTAKYVGAQPIVAADPDPTVNDGVLLAFRPERCGAAVRAVLAGRATVREVTLAEARTSAGDRLLAFNDLFIGARSHVSARYRLRHGDASEEQSSSGVLVSTGAGSTGWLSSVWTMVEGIARAMGTTPAARPALRWEDRRLLFVVREPYVSRHSSASVVSGAIEQDGALVLESRMPSGGQVFSDGIEADWLPFDAGTTVTIRPAEQRAALVRG
jgi:NAD kinase